VDEGVVNEGEGRSFTFKREAPTASFRPPPGQPMSMNVGTSPTVPPPSGSEFVIMPPAADLVEQLLEFQHSMPSWKAAQIESMAWEGTTEENIKRYAENVGVEETPEG